MKSTLVQFVLSIALGLVLCFSISCQSESDKAKLAEMKANADTLARNKHLAEDLIKAFNSHNPAAVAQLYAENQVTIEPGSPEPVRGRKAKEEMLAGTFKVFPDLNIEITHLSTCRTSITFEGYLKGTHTGPMESPKGKIAPTGRSFKTRIAFVVKVSPAGLIEEDRTYYDNADLMKQLGLLK